MANIFTRAKLENVGTVSSDVYTAPIGVAAVTHGIFISNKLSTEIKVSVLIGTTYVLNAVPVPANSTLVPNKPINMIAGDVMKVVSDTNLSADIYVSVLEIS